MRRLLAGLTVALLASSLLTGCSRRQGQAGAVGAPQTPAQRSHQLDEQGK